MNIESISFAGNYNNNHRVSGQYLSRQSSRNDALQRTPQADTYQPRPRSSASRKRQPIIPTPVKAFAAGILAAITIGKGMDMANTPAALVSIPVDPSTSIVQIADLYGTSVEAILAYNDLTMDTDLSSVNSISVPTNYDYLQNEIDQLQAQLYDKHLSASKRDEITNEIEQCRNRQALQQSIATTYTDGKYIYFTIIDPPAGTGNNSINIETFKNIFEIKEGALRSNNHLDSTWRRDPDANPEDKGYFDYTGHRLTAGDTVKVRMDDIQHGLYND